LVNEKGNEAAAATGAAISLRAAPAVWTFRADHPFVFLIRDNPAFARTNPTNRVVGAVQFFLMSSISAKKLFAKGALGSIMGVRSLPARLGQL
jgi:hypothetical protein